MSSRSDPNRTAAPYLNRAQVREIDRIAIEEFGLPGAVLMENAARGLAELLVELGIQGPIAIVCGKGNNGGDGMAMARRLALLGYDPKIVLCANSMLLSGDAAMNYRVCRKLGLPIQVMHETGGADLEWQTALEGADWIVDALLGTGAKGTPSAPLDAILNRLNRSSARKLAVDIPSGMDCDTGLTAPCAFRAHHTGTLAAPKIGFLAAGAVEFTGKVHVLDIGFPVAARASNAASSSGREDVESWPCGGKPEA